MSSINHEKDLLTKDIDETEPQQKGGRRLSLGIIIGILVAIAVVLALALGLGLGLGLKKHHNNDNNDSNSNPTSSGTVPPWRNSTVDYALDMSWDINAAPTTRTYNFTVSEVTLAPDGIYPRNPFREIIDRI